MKEVEKEYLTQSPVPEAEYRLTSLYCTSQLWSFSQIEGLWLPWPEQA